MPIEKPYHEGELAVQQRANESEIARVNGRAIDETILGGALRFIEQQAMVVIGSVDENGEVWSSVLFGEPGFLMALDNRTLELNVSEHRSSINDPLWENLKQNANVGLLVIELGSRRRIRINGIARRASSEKYIVNVRQAYPNCPKYIQRRILRISDTKQCKKNIADRQGAKLSKAQRQLINLADTFFVASAHPEQGVDASHRGGHPGFVKIINNRQLLIPDFMGNSLFNTLGNFVSYPFAGLVFIDFENDRLLQLTGTPEILWEQDDLDEETGGTKRYWQFEISAWRESAVPVKLHWDYMDVSPHLPELKQELTDKRLLPLQVARIQQESERVKSFQLHTTDHSLLPEFEAGAHLKVKVTLPDGSKSDRHYSILSSPAERTYYEIGVLEESNSRGGSHFMHEQVNKGDVLEFQLAKNEFPMASNVEHSILIAGGIGVTPILSMMHALHKSNQSYELHYTARSYNGLVFRNRIKSIAGGKAQFYASQETGGKRLDLNKVLAIPGQSAHVYVCGPVGLINAVRDVALNSGWPEPHIHFESFGVKSLPDDRPIEIYLARSKKLINVPVELSILDTLLNAGVKVPHDCKRGECSMCITRVLQGDPDHRDLCLNQEEQISSMCVCISRARSETLHLDL